MGFLIFPLLTVITFHLSLNITNVMNNIQTLLSRTSAYSPCIRHRRSFCTENSPIRRPRRLRKSKVIRNMVAETRICVNDLVMPLFVIEGNEKETIGSMPGQYRHPISSLLKEIEALQKIKVNSVALFPSIHESLKCDEGQHALDSNTLILRTIAEVKKAFPEVVIFADIALDPYTSHGHDGVFNEEGNDLCNDTTIRNLCEMALLNARAGADFVAPSDMMDGRVGAIRNALDAQGFTTTGILAYSVKYASAYYGPFRDAVGSKVDHSGYQSVDNSSQPVDVSSPRQESNTFLLEGKHTYQMNPKNRRVALIEAELDEEEGADILMVKPAGVYLDVIREVRDNTNLPIAAYQVSGEYAQIHAAAKAGWLDYEQCRDESLVAIKRAGADIIFTYFAKEAAQKLKEEL